MARKTKEVEQIDKNVEEPKKTKKNVEKKASAKTTKKTNTVKKSANKKSTSVKKETSTTKKTKSTTSTKTKKTGSTSKVSNKKSTTPKEKTVAKKVSTKKTPVKKATSKSTESKKTKNVKSASKTKSTKKQSFSLEYYDLPYRYDQTIVTILAQTPKNLFVYWDISTVDRQNLEKQYGSHFFEITKPVLIIHNDSKNYSFEIDVDDFANSWYIPVDDSNSEYRIELGRRPIPINYNYIQNYNGEEIHPVETPYIYLTSSNEIQSPNNKILFNLDKNVYFRNVKTNQVVIKDISNFLLLSNIGRFYNLFDLYKHFYKDEDLLTKEFDIFGLSSSGNPSSGFLSSQFK